MKTKAKRISTTSNWFFKFIVLSAIALAGLLLLFQASSKNSETADPTTNWRTYANTEAKVSFQYPSDWTVKEETPNVEYKRISIKGKEGEILLDYGSGFGGACSSGYEDFKIGSAQTQACHTTPDDGSEKWSLSAMKKNNVSFNNIGYSGFVTANAPYKDNREVVLKILSTFEFAQ